MSSHLNDQRIQHLVETNFILVTPAERKHLDSCSLCHENLEAYRTLFNIKDIPISFSEDFERRIMLDIAKNIQSRNRKIKYSLLALLNLTIIFLMSAGYVFISGFKLNDISIVDKTIHSFGRIFTSGIWSHTFVINTLSGIAALVFLLIVDRLLIVTEFRKSI